VAQYSYEIEPVIYELYDSGAVLKTGDQAQKKLKFYFLAFLASIIFAGYVFYALLGDYVDNADAESDPLPKKGYSSQNINTDDHKKENNFTGHIVKCISFQPNSNVLVVSKNHKKSKRSATSNCYYKNNFTSLPVGFIKGLIQKKISNIKVVYAHNDVTFFTVDDTGLRFIFQTLKRGKDEKDD
jgi:hypothetical protein